MDRAPRSRQATSRRQDWDLWLGQSLATITASGQRWTAPAGPPACPGPTRRRRRRGRSNRQPPALFRRSAAGWPRGTFRPEHLDLDGRSPGHLAGPIRRAVVHHRHLGRRRPLERHRSEGNTKRRRGGCHHAHGWHARAGRAPAHPGEPLRSTSRRLRRLRRLRTIRQMVASTVPHGAWRPARAPPGPPAGPRGQLR